ncbi:hypothetical protein GALMADRAFT_136364 [Galerina marginata CBS 339.88]|uniref:DUF4218 domain-containing protein n=1 Tax=Galerina marginata (strain CBS 339.88) TaxID=685588 RepID=A0A067TL98_GALM3|nr:hypothetical protein GALMADRAFT_136364 [Galerina marginata CBS 339.88]
MQAYLAGLKELFPDYKFVPNQHMALHLRDYILLYGPVHSWWAFPFERMIGKLQHASINYKEDEYSETIARSFVRSANLRQLLEKTGTPEVIRNCKPMFQKLVDPQIRDTLLTDMLSFTGDFDGDDGEDAISAPWSCSSIPGSLMACIAETFDGIHPMSVSLLSNITIQGVIYSVSSRHSGNSSILIQSGQQKVLIPAQIEHIVQLVFPNNIIAPVTFAAARRYQPADIEHDPFTPYPFLRAQLWSRELDTLELYPLESIECHFAYCPMEWEGQQVVAVISLSREF